MLVLINRIFPINDNVYLSDINWCVGPSCDSHMDHNDAANLISGCAKHIYLVIQMFDAVHSFLAVLTPVYDGKVLRPPKRQRVEQTQDRVTELTQQDRRLWGRVLYIIDPHSPLYHDAVSHDKWKMSIKQSIMGLISHPACQDESIT